MARHDPHGKEDLGERFSQFASVCGITDGHDLRSANDTHVMDIWTPAGMLAMNLTDDVTISGSLYDDWHIAPGNP